MNTIGSYKNNVKVVSKTLNVELLSIVDLTKFVTIPVMRYRLNRGPYLEQSRAKPRGFQSAS